MGEIDKQLHETLLAIDYANSLDPNKEMVGHDEVAKELIYGQRMSEELARFSPRASDTLQVAARAQHIERWKSPRSDYPDGLSGYKKWRSQLSLFHAQRAGEIMATKGYSTDAIDKVKYLIQKRQLKRNPETQTLEDVICLVFLKHYFVSFVAKHEEPKIIDILQKTWVKMSEKGQKWALEIDFPPQIIKLLQKTLTK